MEISYTNTMWKKIKRYSIISFDIFDTLIKRNVCIPEDVFDIVQEQFEKNNSKKLGISFKEERKKAEEKARLSSNLEEISLELIYTFFTNKVTQKEKNILKELEIQIEEKVCTTNYPIYNLYQRCLKEGKRIILVSDMYLPQRTIEKILENCGYIEYEKLYLSSTIGLQKITTNLFKFVINDMKVSKKEVVHIGDSKRADFIACMKVGIKSILCNRKIVNTCYVGINDIYQSDRNPYMYINNTLPRYKNESHMFRWGYEAYGPLLLGFCQWIHKMLRDKKIETAFFLARDMYLVVDIYKKLYPNENIKYLEISRKSLRQAYVLKNDKLESIFDTMARVNYSICEICDALEIDVDEIIEKCKEVNLYISVSDKFPLNEDKNNVIFSNVVLDKLKSITDYSVEYLEQMGLRQKGKYALIDIGWHGTIQNMLEKITENKYTGIYFGSTLRKSFKEMETYGYWFDTVDEQAILPKLTMISILEVMLFPKIGTTISYEKKSKGIVPIYGKCEMDESYEHVKEFQNGALEFINNYVKNSLFFNKEILSTIAVKAYEKMAFQPTILQAKTLSLLPYEEGKVMRIAYIDNKRNYFFRPKKILTDYEKAKWKTGFIKQLVPFVKNPHRIDSLIKKIKWYIKSR